MKKSARNVLGMTTICVLLISSVVWAHQSGNMISGQKGRGRQMCGEDRRRPDRDGFGMGINWAELNLTDDQKAQMQEKFREFQTATAELREKMRFARRDVRTVMRQNQVDQAKVDSAWAEIGTLQQQLDEAQTDHMLALRSILTQEQLETIQKNRETRQELQELKAEYRDMLFSSGEIDVEQLKALQAQITEKELALQRDRAEDRAEERAEWLQELTPEQQQQLRMKGRGPCKW